MRLNKNAAKTLFFGLHLNLGAKFRTEIELLRLTKLRQKFRPLGICLSNKKSTPVVTTMSKMSESRTNTFYQEHTLLF